METGKEQQGIVPHLADLARLELSKEEEQRYERDLGEIVNYVGKISNVQASPQPLTATISGVSQVMREDLVDQSILADQLIDLAPTKKDRLVLVPKIL